MINKWMNLSKKIEMLNQIMNYGFTVAIFLLTNSMLFSTSVLAIKSKSDNGNDPCGQIDCIFLDPKNQVGINIKMDNLQ